MSERLTVVGGGIMGAGIAFVAAAAGVPVTVVEPDAGALDAARGRVDEHARRAAKRGGAALESGAVAYSDELAISVEAATFVVEATPEDLALKRSLFGALGAAAAAGTVLASNTSGLPIEVLGAASGCEEMVIGTHFFNPVPAMALVEVVVAEGTAPSTVEHASALCEALGKDTITVRDRPGFITTRIGILAFAEAIRALEEGVASASDIDKGMRGGWNHPVGPLELADRVGLDTILSILDDLTRAYGDAFRAPARLRQMVAAGKLGRKSGAGFYRYG